MFLQCWWKFRPITFIHLTVFKWFLWRRCSSKWSYEFSRDHDSNASKICFWEISKKLCHKFVFKSTTLCKWFARTMYYQKAEANDSGIKNIDGKKRNFLRKIWIFLIILHKFGNCHQNLTGAQEESMDYSFTQKRITITLCYAV